MSSFSRRKYGCSRTCVTMYRSPRPPGLLRPSLALAREPSRTPGGMCTVSVCARAGLVGQTNLGVRAAHRREKIQLQVGLQVAPAGAGPPRRRPPAPRRPAELAAGSHRATCPQSRPPSRRCRRNRTCPRRPARREASGRPPRRRVRRRREDPGPPRRMGPGRRGRTGRTSCASGRRPGPRTPRSPRGISPSHPVPCSRPDDTSAPPCGTPT